MYTMFTPSEIKCVHVAGHVPAHCLHLEINHIDFQPVDRLDRIGSALGTCVYSRYTIGEKIGGDKLTLSSQWVPFPSQLRAKY